LEKLGNVIFADTNVPENIKALIRKEIDSNRKLLVEFVSGEGIVPEEKNINEYGEWTAHEWVEWAFKLGLKLDNKIPFLGVDNRKRIEQAVIEFASK
jgi:hypothetical protein